MHEHRSPAIMCDKSVENARDTVLEATCESKLTVVKPGLCRRRCPDCRDEY